MEYNKMCSMNNLKCKECTILYCKKNIQLIEEEENAKRKLQEQLFIKKLKKQFEYCVIKDKICSYLEILNLKQEKVRCPYMINKECILKKTNKC